jgi:hypothetical protein
MNSKPGRGIPGQSRLGPSRAAVLLRYFLLFTISLLEKPISYHSLKQFNPFSSSGRPNKKLRRNER